MPHPSIQSSVRVSQPPVKLPLTGRRRWEDGAVDTNSVWGAKTSAGTFGGACFLFALFFQRSVSCDMP